MSEHEPKRDIEIAEVQTAQVLPLRQAVLRPGRPLESARFPHDDAPSTKHFAAFRNGTLLGIASVYVAGMPGHPGTSALQLRGMATAPQARGTGIGRALVQACLDHARAQRAGVLWCNARTSAAGFYSRLGFEVVGEPFDIPDVGPHFRMKFVLVKANPEEKEKKLS